MYTIENHLLHLNLGAGVNRDAAKAPCRGKSGRQRPDLPLLMIIIGRIICCNESDDKVTIKSRNWCSMQHAASVPIYPCNCFICSL